MLSPELITFFSAMLPVAELRGSIPLAISVLGLTPMQAMFWAVLGNLIPNFFILKMLGPISEYLTKHSVFFNKFFTKLFEKTRTQHSKKFKEYGSLFFIIFIAIPLPGSGSWTGSLIAFLFGVPYWKAIGLITIGVVLGGIIVTFGFESILRIIALFS